MIVKMIPVWKRVEIFKAEEGLCRLRRIYKDENSCETYRCAERGSIPIFHRTLFSERASNSVLVA